jgi:hypothetical protein
MSKVTKKEAIRHFEGSAGRLSHTPSHFGNATQSSSQYLTILGRNEKKRIHTKIQSKKKTITLAPALYPPIEDGLDETALRVCKVAELDIFYRSQKNKNKKKVFFFIFSQFFETYII